MRKSSKSLLAAIVSVVLVLCMSMVVVFTAFANDAPVVAVEPTTAEGTTAAADDSTVPAEPEETTTAVAEPTEPVEPDETTTDAAETTEPVDPVVGKVGDVNKDGVINTTDARLALRIAVALEHADELQLILADANGDMYVKSGDARMILRYAVQLSNSDDCIIGSDVVASQVAEDGVTAVNDVSEVVTAA